MTKQELRNKIKQINLSSEYIKYSDEIIFNKLIDLQIFKESKILFVYVSRKTEVDTIKLIKYALDVGKVVCVPKCYENSIMKAFQIESLCDLGNGKFNILEPKSYCKELNKGNIDLAIIPCVTCDVNNNRLGYGKGYYDKFLIGFSATKICLCRKQAFQCEIPVDKHDVRMDIVVTDYF
jgi:5-formyltetrahydrofolate cyclo-ligase